MSCLAHAAQLGRMADALADRGVAVLVVGGGSPAAAERVRRLLRLPFPVLSDPDRRAYGAFGFTRALGVLQRSGTVIVDREGALRYRRGGLNPQAAMSRPELLARLEELE